MKLFAVMSLTEKDIVGAARSIAVRVTVEEPSTVKPLEPFSEVFQPRTLIAMGQVAVPSSAWGTDTSPQGAASKPELVMME